MLQVKITWLLALSLIVHSFQSNAQQSTATYFNNQVQIIDTLTQKDRANYTYFNPSNEETKLLKNQGSFLLQFNQKQWQELTTANAVLLVLNGDTTKVDRLGDFVIQPKTDESAFTMSILTETDGSVQSLSGLPARGFRVKMLDAFPEKPFFTKDTVVFGILLLLLALVFYTSSKPDGFWKKLHVFLPALLLCYLLPSILSSLNIIGSEWVETDAYGNGVNAKSGIYHVSSRYLLPAALILLTLSLDLKAVFKLGWKAVVMFLTGTAGIIIGGPIAILLVALVSPETVGGDGFDAVWRGLATLAGSWIGGGANQTAMLEVYKYNQENYGAMVLVDIVVANIWMAVLLFGISKKERIDRWFKADNSDIEDMKQRVTEYEKSVMRIPTLKDLMLILGIAFTAVSLAHWGADATILALKSVPAVQDPTSFLNTFSDHFFWLVMNTTILGVALSFTPLKKFEGAGASKLGSVFIYVLVASIGMKMDLSSVVNNPGLLVVGLIWMAVHAILLIIVAKLIKAPFFFLAVGSKANVGGAASAPIVASAFHPSLASVGVILAIFGYVLGTLGALWCAELMRAVSSV
jgi:uncharacterized membrane protein